jgi:HEAT repeat protein
MAENYLKLLKMNDNNKSSDRINSIIIPAYKPLNTPYSTWEIFRSKELLAANGFDNNEEEWRRATGHPEGFIRGTAFFLLSRLPGEENIKLFRAGLNDNDETVQAFCAFALTKAGDKQALKKLKTISEFNVESHIAAIQAAGLLGQLGISAAFKTIGAAMESKLEYIQLFGIQNAVFFVPLNRKNYDINSKIDIWELYQSALKNKNSPVREVAIAQLQEIKSKNIEEFPPELNLL